MEKLCANCRHYKWGSDPHWAKCNQPVKLTRSRSNIDGSAILLTDGVQVVCCHARSKEGHCGPQATNFEPSRAKWVEHKFYMFVNSWAYWVVLVVAVSALWYFVLPR